MAAAAAAAASDGDDNDDDDAGAPPSWPVWSTESGAGQFEQWGYAVMISKKKIDCTQIAIQHFGRQSNGKNRLAGTRGNVYA